MNIISRKEAIQKGLQKYYTGKPCKNGHYSERYTLGSECQACIKEHVYSQRSEIKAIREKLLCSEVA
jgi:hypothetical protein